MEIAKDFQIPRQMEEHGLPAERVHWSPNSVDNLVTQYTREAGVRKSRTSDRGRLPKGRPPFGGGRRTAASRHSEDAADAARTAPLSPGRSQR